MSKLSPGDFARFNERAAPPSFKGAVVMVLKPFEGYSRGRMLHIYGPGEVWSVELLETVLVRDASSYELMTEVTKAGTTLAAHEGCLTKIDPPADTEEVFRGLPVETKHDLEEVCDKILDAYWKETSHG